MQSPVATGFPARLVLRWVLVVLGLAFAVWLASRIPRTLTIFLVAAFIAFGVEPAVRYLERRMKRGPAIAVVYAVLLLTLVILALLVIPATIVQVQLLVNNAPDYIKAIDSFVASIQDAVRSRFGARAIPAGYGDAQEFVSARFTPVFNATLASLGQIVIGTATALFIAISALVLSAFFLLQAGGIATTAYGFFPKHRQPAVRSLGDEIARIFGDYVAGQTIVCAIVGVAIFASTAVIGFKFALLTAILGGVLYAVPFFGLLIVHAAVLILAAPQGAWMVVWVEVLLFAIGRIADNVLVPKVMSESIGVSPIVVMFAVFAGGELFGIPGLLLGIPAAALAKVMWRFFRTTAMSSRLVTPDDARDLAPPTITTAQS